MYDYDEDEEEIQVRVPVYANVSVYIKASAVDEMGDREIIDLAVDIANENMVSLSFEDNCESGYVGDDFQIEAMSQLASGNLALVATKAEIIR